MSIHDGELTCQEVVELVTEYLENVLLPEARKRLEEHVDNCPGCASYIEQIQLTIGMLRQLADEPVFPTMKQELLQRFRNWKKDASSQGADSP
jgi:predicted anti-sigma-YlaC factor YlaD